MERLFSDSALLASVPSSDRLVVFFSGRLMGFRIDRFAFRRVAEGLGVNRLLLRDHFGLWYQAGLKGLSRDIGETAAWLQTFVSDGGYRRVTMVGVSSGGYAAMLFGRLLGVAEIHAIAPRTVLQHDAAGLADRNRFGVQDSLVQLENQPRRREDCRDLREVFVRSDRSAVRCVIHYDPTHALDAFHAEHMIGVPGVVCQSYPGEGHALARTVCADPGFLDRLKA